VVPLLKDASARRDRSALTSFTFAKNKTGHALRDNRYRYIYYEWNSLEELYDHESDPNEFENRAYDPKLSKIVKRFRSEMLERVEGFEAADMANAPVGYMLSNGRVRATEYQPMSVVPLSKERPKVQGIR
jgi:choline-sulfatase